MTLKREGWPFFVAPPVFNDLHSHHLSPSIPTFQYSHLRQNLRRPARPPHLHNICLTLSSSPPSPKRPRSPSSTKKTHTGIPPSARPVSHADIRSLSCILTRSTRAAPSAGDPAIDNRITASRFLLTLILVITLLCAHLGTTPPHAPGLLFSSLWISIRPLLHVLSSQVHTSVYPHRAFESLSFVYELPV